MKSFVLGKSLPHTLSPEIHSAFGLNDYGVVEVEENKLKNVLLNSNYDFCNVTVPYKTTVIKFLNSVSQVAKTVGAVNTIVNKNGCLIGYNTDVYGLEFALKRANIIVENKVCLILGTGATSKTAEFVLRKMGAEKIIKVGRTSAVNYENVYEISAQVVVNTTPVGTFPNNFDSPIDLSKINGIESVFDVVYNPLETALISQGKKLGLKTGNGLAMLVEQARVAQNFAYGENFITFEKSELVIDKLYKSKRNVALIGMPGSGKSTVALAVAKKLNRQLIDLDSEICKKTGLTIPEIFNNFGEEYFRKIETEVLNEACFKLGVVIATGGGAPCFGNNLQTLKQNCFVVHLKRNLENLATGGRPLSNSLGVEKIYAQRKAVYSQAHACIENSAEIEIVAERIIDCYEENSRY